MKNLFLFCILFTCTTKVLLSQTQVGQDINGEEGDRLGYSVSISSDGNRVAIGSLNSNLNGLNSGVLKIYEWNGESWQQIGNSIYGESSTDQFAASISLSSDGNRVAVAAYRNNGNGISFGLVKIYQWSENDWIQVGGDIEGKENDESIGRSIALSEKGDKIAITSEEKKGISVYELKDEEWIRLGEVLYDNKRSNLRVDLSKDGNRLVVGDPLNGDNGTGTGAIQVYEWKDSTWVEMGGIIYGESGGDQFGFSVSISSNGKKVAVGSPYSKSSNDGAMSVYEWRDNSWNQMGDFVYGRSSDERLGFSISISSNGNRVAVGSPYRNNGRGRVQIYDFINEKWQPTNAPIEADEGRVELGYSTSISFDGSKIAIGIPKSNGNGFYSGQVQVHGFLPVPIQNPLQENSIKIYPNPTRGKLFISNHSSGTLKVINKFGQKILEHKIKKTNSEISISNLPKGLYFLEVHYRNNYVIKKIIKH